MEFNSEGFQLANWADWSRLKDGNPSHTETVELAFQLCRSITIHDLFRPIHYYFRYCFQLL